MKTKTTRSTQFTEKQENLYLAFELSNSTWKLGFSVDPGQPVRERDCPAGNTEKLQKEIEAAKKRFNLSASAEVRSCYEAGRDGFWLHRYLTKNGIENLIVDSSSIEVNRRAKQTKTDRIDVKKLVSMLMRYYSGEKKLWSIVRVPTVEEEDRRHLHRELKGLKKERTRSINRIRGLLANQGVKVKLTQSGSSEWIEQIRLWDGTSLPKGLQTRIKREWAYIRYLNDQILAVEGDRRKELQRPDGEKERDVKQVEQLLGLRAIGINGAWVLVREFFGWRKF